MQPTEHTQGGHEIAQPGKAMSITIEEDPEQAIETFARLSTLGHFAKAATLFEDVLQTYIDELPVFAEYANFLIQQGRYGALLDLVKERSNMKTAAKPEEEEIVYLELLRALSMLHFEGRLLDTLEAMQHRVEFYATLIRPPVELTYIQIRSVGIYLAIITAAISVLPKGAIKYKHNVNVQLPGDKTYVFETGASISAQSPWVELQEWCVLLAKEHPYEAMTAFRTLLSVLPADKHTSSWASKFITFSLSSGSRGPESILARVGAMNAWMWLRRPGRRHMVDENETSTIDVSQASPYAEQTSFGWASKLSMISLLPLTASFTMAVAAPISLPSLVIPAVRGLYRYTRSRDEGESRGAGGASTDVKDHSMTAKEGFDLLDGLYEVGYDEKSQQVIELELNAIAADGKCHRLRTGLDGLAIIAREEGNYRLESHCLQLMLEISGGRSPMSAMLLPILSPGAFYTHIAQDAIELVNLLDQFPSTETTLQASASMESLAAFRLTVDRGVEPSLTSQQRLEEHTSEPIHQAARNGYESIARILRDHDETILSNVDEDRYLPLHVAAKNGHDALLPFLLGSQKEHIDKQVKYMPGNQERGTALHLASANGHKKAVASLLHCKAMVDVKDVDGWTALHQACARWQYGAANLLLRHGADVNSRTPKGLTALELAVKSGFTALVGLLLQHQSASDCDGNCGPALMLALEERDLETASLLLGHTIPK